ncbi:MAG: TerC family protein [Fimbriimonadia bacterium]|nr:TerC family protein [Fimbriimonadia bacterium]
MGESMWLMALFGVVVGVCMVIDLFVLHRKAHEVRLREALNWVIIWISLAALFNLAVYFQDGKQRAIDFALVYLVELSLSVDNLFVFMVIFNYFRVPPAYQHRVLFWGVVGALAMRAVFILVGVSLLNLFHWMVYVFGAVLILTGLRLLLKPSQEVDIERSFVVRVLRRVMPISSTYDGQRFLTRFQGRLSATPLLVVLLLVESTDLLFAVDSIPAALAISRDTFVVYTANVFAVLGLRSFYFVASRFMNLFAYLHYGLSFVLAFIGVKMILSPFYKIPSGWSLGVIATTLVVSVGVSMLFPPTDIADSEEEESAGS